MKEETFCVAIDGPAGSGKSTVAKLVAKKLRFTHLNSGLIYRSLAYKVSVESIPFDNPVKLKEALNQFKKDFRLEEKKGVAKCFLKGEEITDFIKTPSISELSSKIAVIREVRGVANEIQREIAQGKHLVIEGRDVGTNVFPDAKVKIFLTAKAEVRAKRRWKELQKLKTQEKSELPPSKTHSYEEVLLDVMKRDERDINREHAPLKRALDAVIIDTTNMSIHAVVKEIIHIVKANIPKKPGKIWTYLLGEERARAHLLYKLLLLFTIGFFRLFYRIEVRGLENFPRGALIIAPNHVSFLDPPIIASFCPYELHALAQEYLFRVPLLNIILPQVNTHPIRGDGGDFAVMKETVLLLAKGMQVMIFPEGSRSLDGEVAPLKRGVALLSSMTNCRILPTVIIGAYEAWPRGKIFPRLFKRIRIVFGKPISWDDYSHRFESKKEAQGALTEDLEKILKQMKEENLI